MKANDIIEEMVGVLSIMKLRRECSRKFDAWVCIIEEHCSSFRTKIVVQLEMFYLFVSLRSEG